MPARDTIQSYTGVLRPTSRLMCASKVIPPAATIKPNPTSHRDSARLSIHPTTGISNSTAMPPGKSTNPLCVGIPTNGEPVVLDIGTSVVAEGKVFFSITVDAAVTSILATLRHLGRIEALETSRKAAAE